MGCGSPQRLTKLFELSYSLPSGSSGASQELQASYIAAGSKPNMVPFWRVSQSHSWGTWMMVEVLRTSAPFPLQHQQHLILRT